MQQMSEHSLHGSAPPLPSWLSGSSSKNSTCFWRFPRRRWWVARSRCQGKKFGNIAGLSLIVLGTAMVAIAAIRFLTTAKAIDSEQLDRGPGSRIDLTLAALLVLLGCALFVYLSHAFVTKL